MFLNRCCNGWGRSCHARYDAYEGGGCNYCGCGGRACRSYRRCYDRRTPYGVRRDVYTVVQRRRSFWI